MYSYLLHSFIVLGSLTGSLAFQSLQFRFTRHSAVACSRAKRSKWDDLIDEDDEDVAPDMTYEPHNLIRQHEHFHAIRAVGGKEMTADVYVRDPQSDTFYYVGKVARVSDISLEKAVARQFYMIERHAGNLRPIELWPHRGNLQIWAAPGDSELDVAYNRPGTFQKMERNVDGASKVRNHFIGFQGEVYQKGEEGFRTWRTDDGLPARPEINPGGTYIIAPTFHCNLTSRLLIFRGFSSGETRPPTKEELEQLQKEFQQNNGSNNHDHGS